MFKIMLYGGSVLAAIFLIASIVLFIRNDVAKLIGDITGWNARKAIKKLDKKGAEETSKTEAINTEVSKVLVHSATTTGTLKELQDISDKLTQKKKKSRRSMPKQSKEEKTELLENKEFPKVSDTTENAEPISGIFQMEEEMVVLAGEKVDENRMAEFQDNLDGGELTTLLVDEEGTELLTGNEATTLLAEEEGTELLTGNEATTLLAEEEGTELLTGDEATTLLAEEEGTELLTGDEATTLLTDDEATTLLAGEEATTLLTGGETEDILEDGFEPVICEDEEIANLLRNHGGYLTDQGKDKT